VNGRTGLAVLTTGLLLARCGAGFDVGDHQPLKVDSLHAIGDTVFSSPFNRRMDGIARRWFADEGAHRGGRVIDFSPQGRKAMGELRKGFLLE
jgi:hypothetical protein